MALGCWGEDSNLSRLNVSANRCEAGPNPASRLCAEHIRQLGGESPLSNPDGGEGLAKRKGVA